MNITTQKIGGIWHGYLVGHPEIDERGLTEQVVRSKVERIVEANGWCPLVEVTDDKEK
jgi:hypothetical protein